MSRQHHYLKIETEYFQAHEEGLKNFEIRKNDRNFQVGDMVYLKEVVNEIYTGRVLEPKEIQYIFKGGMFGLDKDYCILDLK